jgi:predicted RNA-binding protein with PIN domain
MATIVDGYNVLFAIAHYRGQSVSDAIDEARERLMDRLARYGRRTGEGVTVVFDSRKGRGGAEQQETPGGVRVLYSHPPRIADDDIKRLVEASASGGQVRVITSDRELAHACRQRGASVAGAMTFWRELSRAVEDDRGDQDETIQKHQAPSDEEMREYLDAFGDADDVRSLDDLDFG